MKWAWRCGAEVPGWAAHAPHGCADARRAAQRRTTAQEMAELAPKTARFQQKTQNFLIL